MTTEAEPTKKPGGPGRRKGSKNKPKFTEPPKIALLNPDDNIAAFPNFDLRQPVIGTRAWYEMQLAGVEAALVDAPPAAVAPLHRRIQQYAEIITKLREKEEPEVQLSQADLVAKMSSEAAQMADVYLEVFVREYTSRHRLKLVRA